MDLTPLPKNKIENVKAFCNLSDSKYYLIARNGDLLGPKNEKDIKRHLFTQYKQSIDIVKDNSGNKILALPDMMKMFLPDQPSRFLIDKKTQEEYFNSFMPSKYMNLEIDKDKEYNIPPTINTLLDNLIPDLLERAHFLNHLAYVLRVRKKAGTAFVFIGTQGTGKTLLCGQIFRKLFDSSLMLASSADVSSNFNAYDDGGLVLVINEADSKKQDRGLINAKLKTSITDTEISINKKGINAYTIKSYSSLYITTNNEESLIIETEDRRYNVVKSRSQKINDHPDFFEGFFEELLSDETIMQFANYLHSITINEKAVRTALDNKAKNAFVEASAPAVEMVASCIRKNNYQYMEQIFDDFDLESFQEQNQSVSNPIDIKNKIQEARRDIIPRCKRIREEFGFVVLKKDAQLLVRLCNLVRGYKMQNVSAIGRHLSTKCGFSEGKRLSLLSGEYKIPGSQVQKDGRYRTYEW